MTRDQILDQYEDQKARIASEWFELMMTRQNPKRCARLDHALGLLERTSKRLLDRYYPRS